MKRWVPFSILVLVGCLAAPLPVRAQTKSSAVLVKELVALLEQQQLENVAARVPGERDRFAAALYMPKSEILTVSARYTVPVLLQEQIYGRKYRDAYVALNGAGAKTGKMFIEDTGADGLTLEPGPNGRFDIIYQEVTHRTLLNGVWKDQKLSEQQYKQRFEAAEQAYVPALAAMIGELKNTASTH